MVLRVVLISFVVFLLAIFMAMVGRGGGNFYVPSCRWFYGSQRIYNKIIWNHWQ